MKRTVERQQDVPDAAELLLVPASRAEMRQEGPDRLLLPLVQPGEIVLHGTEIRDVGEEFLRIHQVFVHVVEVGQQHPAPEDEFVQRLRLFPVKRLVAVIQGKQEVHPVGLPRPAEPVEEVVHRVQGRHAHRTARPGYALAQVLAEKRHGTPVREDEAQVFNVHRGMVVPGHLVEKRSHRPISGSRTGRRGRRRNRRQQRY